MERKGTDSDCSGIFKHLVSLPCKRDCRYFVLYWRVSEAEGKILCDYHSRIPETVNTELSKSLSEELSYMIQWSLNYQWGRRSLWPLKCLTDVTFQLQLVLTICIQYIQKPCWWLPAFTAHSNHKGLKKRFLDIHFAQRHCTSNHIRTHTRKYSFKQAQFTLKLVRFPETSFNTLAQADSSQHHKAHPKIVDLKARAIDVRAGG